ncbi:MAG: hypothetical protein ABWW70_01040 [Thermoproteota archaeon]
MPLSRIAAVVYLHALRTWRYKYSFANSAINMTLWIAIFILGTLAFVPAEQLPTVAPYLFWGIVSWQMISVTVMYVAGWTTWVLLVLGMVEEHMLHNTRTLHVLLGRMISIAAQLAVALPLTYAIVAFAAGGPFPLARDPLLVGYGLAAITAMAFGYALVLAAASLRTSVPASLLDMANFLLFVVGGVAVPVSRLPGPLRAIALAIPYSHAAEVVRYGAAGLEPLLPLRTEILASGLLAAALMAAGYAAFRLVEDVYVRRSGVRGVGRM